MSDKVYILMGSILILLDLFFIYHNDGSDVSTKILRTSTAFVAALLAIVVGMKIAVLCMM